MTLPTINDDFEFNVAKLAPVRAHHVYAMNYHLAGMIKRFDQEYGKIAVSNPPRHAQERMQFARIIAEDMIKLHVTRPGEILALENRTKHTMPDIGEITVWQESTFE